MSRECQVVVIGAGIGGLTAAALLAKQGFQVTVVEANPYPGGSAATFLHKGYRFEAGATVAGGFHAGGPLDQLGDMLGLRFDARPHDPAWMVRLPDREFALWQDGRDLRRLFPQSDGFWREQQEIADLTWAMAARGLPFPPADMREALQLARLGLAHFPRDLRLVPFAARTVGGWLRQHGLANDAASAASSTRSCSSRRRPARRPSTRSMARRRWTCRGKASITCLAALARFRGNWRNACKRWAVRCSTAIKP